MLSAIADKAEAKIAQAVQTTLLGLGACLMLTAGLSFLTVALWIFIATSSSALVAASVIGCAYVGAGFVVLAILAGRKKARKQARAAAAAAASEQDVNGIILQIILAFVSGIRAGQQSRH